MSKTSILLRIYLFLCMALPYALFCQTSQSNSSLGGIPFSYSLSSSAKTSAGVYKPDSTLVRTLWSNEVKAAGTHTASWDGKDDAGTLMPDGNYRVQVLYNNVTYIWEGVIGNTSDSLSGSKVHHSSVGTFYDLRIIGNKGYYATAYNEGSHHEFSFNKSTPQIKEYIWPSTLYNSGLVTERLCNDGTNIYFGGSLTDPPTAYRSFIYARKVSDNSITAFPNGATINTPYGHNTFTNAIDTFTGNQLYSINGMAVQKTGNYLFVSRQKLNSLHVLNKTTGALIQSLTYTAPGYMDTDNNGNLWMVIGTTCKKYTVNGDGTLTELFSLSGLVNPVAIQVTPDGSKVYVADGGSSQQVKIFNNVTGALLSTFGQAGGYATSPVVANDKFMFRVSKQYEIPNDPYNPPPSDYASICFDASDNSWWLLDYGNQRNLHFSASNTLIETFMSVGYQYSTSIDNNSPTRLFSNYLEFQIDYSKQLDNSRNGSWKLVKNWSYGITGSYDNQFRRLYGVYTLSNGRTYALNGKIDNTSAVVELSTTGLRFTGQEVSYNTVLQKDGSLWEYQGTGPTVWKKRTLTGFDGNNNPIWGGEVMVASVLTNDASPANNGGSGFRANQITANGSVISFNNERSSNYHLGAVKPGGNTWLWQAALSTHRSYNGEFPKDGTYDVGNDVNNAGSNMQAIDRNIFWGYKGEFWKNGQTNYINQYYDNGLMIGQFGTNKRDASETGITPPMMAGNQHSVCVVKVGADYYLYHNDESWHGGVHRWKITGLNTIQEQTLNITKLGTPPVPVFDYTDLMTGLPFDDTLANNTEGWTRFAPESGSFKVKTNHGTYKRTERDLRIFSLGQNVDCWVKRELGSNTGLVNWKITGELAYPEAGEYGDNFMEVLDANDRIIVRISRPETYPNLEIKANASRIAFGNIYTHVGQLRPLSIEATSSTITINYSSFNPVTVSPFNSQADISNPTTLRFYTVSHPSGHQINIARLKFYKNIGISPGHFRSKATGLWKNNSSWQSSQDSTNWVDAANIPDSSSKSIAIYNGHTITLTDTVTVDQLTILNSSGLKIAPNAMLKISDRPGNDVTVAGSATMLIQSDATGTGKIGYSTGNIAGNVTVERYIAANNNLAYRLLAPSVNTAGGPKPYIRSNWQEGQNNGNILANSNNTPNYGIHITGSMMGANGFDATLAATPSLLYFNQTATVPAWVPVANTDATNLDVKKGYLVYVRGDRSTDLHNNSTSSNTTLRTTGTVAGGTQTFTGLEGNGRNSLVTNPYPCAVDWSVIYNDPSTANAANFENYYTYWDPNMGVSGGYVTVNANGTKSAGSNATTEIQPGQAFFVRAKPGVASPTLTIKEIHKSGTSNVSVFRIGAREQFRSALYYSDAGTVRRMADAANAVFDTAFSPSVDGNDAEEMANWDENVGITRASKMFSIEGRPLIELTDTLQLMVQRLKTQNYEWQFEPVGFAQANLKAYLEDKYTGQRLQMSLASITVVPFSVTSASGSSAPDRFRIVFAPNSSLPITMRSLKAYQKGTGIEVAWVVNNEINVERYEVEKSLDGRNFIKSGSVLPNSQGSIMNTYNWFDQQPKEGNNYYRIRTIDKNGTVSYSGIVNVKIGSQKEKFDIYPNPLEGNYVTIQFNNLVKGTYTVNFINVVGQKVISKVVNHSGGSGSQTIRIDNSLPPGSYTLQITGEGVTYNKKIVK